MTVSASAPKPGSSSSHDSAPSSVPSRASSVPNSRNNAASSSLAHPRRTLNPSAYSTWLLLDVDHHALPFLTALHSHSSHHHAATDLASASTSPAATTSEKLTQSTNTLASLSAASPRFASAASNVRSQASKYENGISATALDNAEKDRRMSLQHHAGSTARKGFMSRLRAAGGSVSSPNAFHPPASAAPLSTSGSWSIVDPPTPINQQAVSPRASPSAVHLAFTCLATDAALRHAHALVARACSSVLPSPTQASRVPTEQVHSDRIQVAGVAALVQAVQPEAIYIGSARSPSTTPALQSYLEAVLLSRDSLKCVILEPASARLLSSAQASTLFDLARASGIILCLPIRWASLWTPSVDETLLGLQILHDLSDEQTHTPSMPNGDVHASVHNSFDVSISNITTGLSPNSLNELAQLDHVKAQVEHLTRELANRDKRIAELTKQPHEHSTLAETNQPTSSAPSDNRGHPSPAAIGAVESAPPVLLSPPNHCLVASPATPTPTATSSPASSLSRSASIPTSSQHLAKTNAAPEPAAHIVSSATLLTSSSPSSPNSRSSGKVIAALTSELSQTKTLLEATRSALALVKAQSAQYQASADDMRSTLSRARLENDSSVTILARKDRQISEALERARKAEGEAKELGRASREWGTRVREVEDELGKERIKRSRAEQAYDTLSSEWKTARERLIAQVHELKESHRASIADLAKEYQKIVHFKERLKHEWAGYTPSPDSNHDASIPGPKKLVDQIEALNRDMQNYLDKQVSPLMHSLKQLEQRENAHIVDRLNLLTNELTRIKTLMRRGDITSPHQVPPSSL